MGVEPSIDRNIFPRVVDQLLWCPWEQSHPCETSKHRWGHGWKCCIPRANGSPFGWCDWNGIIWSICNSSATRGVGKRGKHIEATSVVFWGIKPNGRDCKTCSWCIAKGYEFNACPIDWNNNGAQCVAWKIGWDTKKGQHVRTNDVKK